MNKQKTYGLIGYPLGHSFSPSFFTKKFEEESISNSVYKAFPLESIKDFTELLKQEKNLSGLNVTIPYKESIIPYLDELSDIAKEIGAVNTIIFKNGKLIGDNTDVYGFQKSLELFYPADINQSALILGSGGASKAVQYVLKKKKIRFQVVSRKKESGYINYKETTKAIIQSNTLIINTTPLGMHPYKEKYPKLKYKYLGSKHYLYDLIYNPKETIFLKKGIEKQAHTKSGGDMLIFQAEKSWKLWNL